MGADLVQKSGVLAIRACDAKTSVQLVMLSSMTKPFSGYTGSLLGNGQLFLLFLRQTTPSHIQKQACFFYFGKKLSSFMLLKKRPGKIMQKDLASILVSQTVFTCFLNGLTANS